jgi:hypothetical protein
MRPPYWNQVTCVPSVDNVIATPHASGNVIFQEVHGDRGGGCRPTVITPEASIRRTCRKSE